MSFLIFVLCGVAGGVFGGMGMGGGTLLIPLLTAVCGVSQSMAQGVNLVCFLPMSCLALSVHAKNGLLVKEGLLSFILPALLLSLCFSMLAVFLNEKTLSCAFGIFLIVLSVFQAKSALKKSNKTHKTN